MGIFSALIGNAETVSLEQLQKRLQPTLIDGEEIELVLNSFVIHLYLLQND
jgi:hypothetical protein